MPQIYQQLHQIVVRDSRRRCSLTFRFFTADVDDLNICYVLRNEENATSDLFHFSVQDNGKAFTLLLSSFLFLGFAPAEPKGLGHTAKWHFNKMLKDTNWLRWRSNLPLYLCGIVSVTFKLVSSGGSVSHLLSLSFWEEGSLIRQKSFIAHTIAGVMDSWAGKHPAAHSHLHAVDWSSWLMHVKHFFKCF